ncbi:MAG: SDR family NAD(P)-dependent oxidoreductase [Methyloligellaceae bacterium]
MARFTDKIVIITGAGSGIGRSAAQLFAAEGAKVTAVDINETVNETVDLIKADGLTAKAVQADAGSEEDISSLVDSVVAEHGGLDIMCANAGVAGGTKGLFDVTGDDWMNLLRVNLVGPFLAIKYAAPHMKTRGGGSIICTASVAGLRSGAGGAPYSASKAGVINLVQTSAQQLSTSNIRVNAVCPGLIETGMTQVVFDYARSAGKEDKIGRLNPMRRGGKPEEIARAMLFLASDDASYVNGQALAVDGGLSSSHPVTRQEYGQVAF